MFGGRKPYSFLQEKYDTRYPVFSPDGKWMVTDTYPDPKTRNQTIRLLNMKTDSVIILGSYPEPAAFTKGWRADIHCRWSLHGDLIGFNSAHSGSRQVYILKVH